MYNSILSFIKLKFIIMHNTYLAECFCALTTNVRVGIKNIKLSPPLLHQNLHRIQLRPAAAVG